MLDVTRALVGVGEFDRRVVLAPRGRHTTTRLRRTTEGGIERGELGALPVRSASALLAVFARLPSEGSPAGDGIASIGKRYGVSAAGAAIGNNPAPVRQGASELPVSGPRHGTQNVPDT